MPRHTDNHWLETIAVTGIPVTGGAGATEYTEDAASAADPIGPLVLARRKDTLSGSQVSADGDNIALNATSKGELYVKQTDSQIVAGDIAAASADSGNPVKIGGKYNSTPPTYTTGQRTDLQTGARGSVNMTIVGQDGVVGAKCNNPQDSMNSTDGALLSVSQNMGWNGASFDRLRVPNKFIPLSAVSIASETTIWTPASGKKFRIMGYAISQGTVGGAITLKDNTAGTTILVIPANTAGVFQASPPMGNGVLSAAANNVLTATGSATETMTGFIFGTEE